jgi:hypothetical protein
MTIFVGQAIGSIDRSIGQEEIRMGIFLRLNNVDRVPGLVVRVKGIDEIEIDVEPLQPYEVSSTQIEERLSENDDSISRRP